MFSGASWLLKQFQNSVQPIQTPLCNRPGEAWLFTRFFTKILPGQTKIHQVDPIVHRGDRRFINSSHICICLQNCVPVIRREPLLHCILKLCQLRHLIQELFNTSQRHLSNILKINSPLLGYCISYTYRSVVYRRQAMMSLYPQALPLLCLRSR